MHLLRASGSAATAAVVHCDAARARWSEKSSATRLPAAPSGPWRGLPSRVAGITRRAAGLLGSTVAGSPGAGRRSPLVTAGRVGRHVVTIPAPAGSHRGCVLLWLVQQGDRERAAVADREAACVRRPPIENPPAQDVWSIRAGRDAR